MFCSVRFMVSGLPFKSLIHFELILWYKIGSNFTVLHVAVQFSQHLLLKKLVFPHYIFLILSLKNKFTIHVWLYFWTPCSAPLVYVSVLMPVPYCFDYYCFIIYIEIKKCDGLQLCSAFSILLRLFSLYVVPQES